MKEAVGADFLEEGRDVSTETHRSELCLAEAGGEGETGAAGLVHWRLERRGPRVGSGDPERGLDFVPRAM